MEYGNGKTNQLTWRENENRYHNQSFDVDADNPNVNVAVLSQFVKKGDKVLDFGCGEGKFGAVLKDNRKLLVGIDLDEAAAIYAKKHYGYDEVFIFNIENDESIPKEFSIYAADNNKFDIIMLLDVLEHLMNPSEILSRLVQYLNNKGKILVSIPNVNNADIFLNLLRDHFNYREAGVLDNTHVKYFTKTSFVEWIGEMNELYDWSMDCEYVGSIYAYTDYLEEVKKSLPALYSFVQLNPYFHVTQHMFVLTFFDSKRDTPQLTQLLSEQPEDLTYRLNEIIAKAGSNNDMMDIKLLPNERKIMEEQFNVAQKGWEECSEALEQLRKSFEAQQKDNKELRQSLDHGKKDNKELRTALEHSDREKKELSELLEHSKKEKKELREALEHGNKDNIGLREALGHSNKDNIELREALEHSNKDNIELREALEHSNKDSIELREALEHSNKDNIELREALEHSNKDNIELREALDNINNEIHNVCKEHVDEKLTSRSILSRLKKCKQNRKENV